MGRAAVGRVAKRADARGGRLVVVVVATGRRAEFLQRLPMRPERGGAAGVVEALPRLPVRAEDRGATGVVKLLPHLAPRSQCGRSPRVVERRPLRQRGAGEDGGEKQRAEGSSSA